MKDILLGTPYIDLILDEADKSEYCHKQGKYVNPKQGFGAPPCISKAEYQKAQGPKISTGNTRAWARVGGKEDNVDDTDFEVDNLEDLEDKEEE